MSTNKKARPDTAIPERERMGAETGQDTTSTINDTTPTPSGQAVKIADLLGHGQNAAVPLRHLKELAGLTGRTAAGYVAYCHGVRADLSLTADPGMDLES